MKFGLDEYAYLDSPIHRWSPKCRLLGLGALIFAFSFVHSLTLSPFMIGVTVILYRVSTLPLSFLLLRLRIPSFFLLIVAILTPFFTGSTVLFQLGALNLYKEGLQLFLLITIRFLCILTLGLILFSAAPFFINIRAMRSLGLSPILADMMLLSYRYVYEVGDYLSVMRTAMRLRGFRGDRLNRRNLSRLVMLAGSLLVRSYEKSEQVYKAMILRGYGQSSPIHKVQVERPRDFLLLGAHLCLAVSFIIAGIVY
ncbi:MAG: cobalt ECF transporter T component CbiQ [Leptolyngbyaceae cyanobacterium MO_188.B28]|nr:cobalt ECF transporter T component CbiQ [Leptolyngbyaceae cyanobacterium MO_188.B28]